MDNCRQQLSVAKSHAESVAVITPELQQAFLEVCILVEVMMLHWQLRWRHCILVTY